MNNFTKTQYRIFLILCFGNKYYLYYQCFIFFIRKNNFIIRYTRILVAKLRQLTGLSGSLSQNRGKGL